MRFFVHVIASECFKYVILFFPWRLYRRGHFIIFQFHERSRNYGVVCFRDLV